MKLYYNPTLTASLWKCFKLILLFVDIFRDFLEETFDVKSHANQAIQGRAITEQLSKLAEGIALLDKEIHSQVKAALTMQNIPVRAIS